MTSARLRAVCDLSIPAVREGAGRHEYDGVIQDLSPEGVRSGLARLRAARAEGSGSEHAPETEREQHDERHLAAFELGLEVALDELELHRRDPLVHADNLDLACYDRTYAPAEERAAARREHLRRWPDAVDMAVASLDRVPAPVAEALLGAVRGLAAGISADDGEVERAALAAHARFVAHVETAATSGPPEMALGEQGLARLMGVREAVDLDVGALAAAAERERDRLLELLREACGRVDATREPAEVVGELLRDHPDIEGVLAEAREQTAEVMAFTAEHRLVPFLDGECLVGPAPESRSWAMAMMTWAAPYEADAPSWYHVTPPDPAWPAHSVEEWLSVFSRTTLPAITAHEVAPGHFSHGRALRRAPGDVRRTLQSMTFAEGWAHYVEEVMLEEGFRDGDARFAVGVALEALVRVTRLSSAIGLHTGAMSVEDATQRFMSDAFLGRSAAESEARRGTFDATYGRYTWGKLAILDLRDRARQQWGSDFSLPRFHAALLELGSPPLGLLPAALD
ncbi:MAG: DUF885 family protein [Actinomycetales bacterium]